MVPSEVMLQVGTKWELCTANLMYYVYMFNKNTIDVISVLKCKTNKHIY